MSPTRRQFLAATVAAAAASRVRAAEAPPAAGFQFVEQDGGRLHIAEGGQPVLAYNWGDQLKEGVPADRKRSCYVHPLWGLDGEILTDDFPKDHYHHRGLSWMWNRVRAGGKEVDLWTIKGIRARFGKWIDRKADADGAALAVENHWVMDGPPVMKETVRLAVHKAGAMGRAIDVDLTLEALGQNITLLGEPKKGYGGLCLRFAPRTDTAITTDKETQAKDSDTQRVPWADLSAKFAGRKEPSGAAIFVNPANPTTPNTWTLRNYGFLGPCWPGMETATLEPGNPVALKYRLWIHRGDAAAGGAAAAWEAYRKAKA